MKSTTSTTTRHKILESAYHLARENGILHLTLDGVAKHAGVSKGGLLYHFSSKEALISGLIHYLLEQHTTALQQAATEQGVDGGILRTCIKMAGREKIEKELSLSILVAAVNNQELLAPVRHFYRELHKHIRETGIDPALGLLLRLALDGLFWAELLDLEPPDSELRKRLLELMEKILEWGLAK